MKITKKNKGGRPSKYNPEYEDKVYKLCLLGATDSQIADFFGIAESNLNIWKKKYPKFQESIKKGKIDADSKVANSLFHRALGYEHSDVDIKVIKDTIVQTKLIKHYPPDPTSAIFWLKNRQSKIWRDKTETEHSGNVTWTEEPPK